MHYLYNQKIRYHGDLLDLLQQELETLPEGSMKIFRGKYVYQVVNRKERSITKDTKLIAQYCRKALVLFLIKHLEKARTLPAYLHRKWSIKEMIARLPASYQGFPQHYYFHSQYGDWLKMQSPPATFHVENLKYPTSKGIFVRSKSESFVVNHLVTSGIPFLYEASFQAGGQPIYPDFLLFCPYTGRLIPWEHFGALHQDGYERKMRDKIQFFHDLGFEVFHNVIYSFESDIEDPDRIKELIERVVLNPTF